MGHQRLQALFSNHDDLYTLIGRQVRYLGEDFFISDLLINEDMMILSSHYDKAVQDDSFGRATRLVPKQHRLKFRDTEGNPTVIWDDIVFLDGAL
jgi:hypothetical protein